MKRQILFLIGWLLFFFSLSAQEEFRIRVRQSDALTNVPAIHSGAYIHYGNYWVFVGGRQNGLHGFQPPFAFPNNGINNNLYVVRPSTNEIWSAPLNQLPDSIREPLTCSNLQFVLRDSMLYLMGGYGWKNEVNDFVTFPSLIAINLNNVIPAVISGGSVLPFIRQITDQRLAVCGAHAVQDDSSFALVFGHRFDGRYNRMNGGGFFTQQYTEEIRRFDITDDGNTLGVQDYRVIRDSFDFHRRDYNLLPQLFPFGDKGFTAFSGVFRRNIDLPFFSCISIWGNNYIVHNAFQQQFSHYHSAVAMLYDSSAILQHNLFFGGMSMYYTDSISGQTVTDSLVPFVNTISDVVRNLDNTYFEFLSDEKMPALMGTNAYFMPAPGIPLIWNDIIDLNALPDSAMIGYIMGGIESPELNISNTDPSLSYAGNRCLEVWLEKGNFSSFRPVSAESVSGFAAYPNPIAAELNVEYQLKESREIELKITDVSGRELQKLFTGKENPGKINRSFSILPHIKGNIFLQLSYGNGKKVVKLIRK